MKENIAVAIFGVLSAGAATAGALQNPLQGSDTEFSVTTDAIAKAGLAPANAYVGGGSNPGETAMIIGEQTIAPMARLMANAVCSTTTTEASSVVVGLDAVEVFSNTNAGASSACNGAGGGLAIANTPTRWKDVLTLVYGGEPNPADPAHFMCNGPLRTALVASWSNLFNNGCANPVSTCVIGGPQFGQLWHAFRRDDASDTSGVFASLVGMSPSPSVSALNGFGTSPFCNALNWETANGNGKTCALGKNKQYVGPGGVADTAAADSGLHRTPPPGVWGTTPISPAPNDADVLPTSMQDNDPIRRKCLGLPLGTSRPAEDVCNLDGNLGLVLSIPSTDFIVKNPPIAGLAQYPIGDTNAFGGFVGCGGPAYQVKAPGILNCAPQSVRKHNGQCPDGDSILFGGACLAKAAATGSAATGVGTQCLAAPSQVPTIQVSNTVTRDGRVQNMFMFDGINGGGYIPQTIVTAAGPVVTDGVLGMGRIHSASVVSYGVVSTTCNLVNPDDQIGCLLQADPCSVGLASDSAKTWGSRKPGGAVASTVDALQVDGVYPQASTVQLFGQPGEYELSRKLYVGSLGGFPQAASTTLTSGSLAGSVDPDELALAEAESTPGFINGLLVSDGLFTLGPTSPMGADTQFCEDFNQALVCGAASNDNACSRNVNIPIIANATGMPSPIPSDPSADPTQSSTSTVCGNGKIEAYEECDPSTATQPAHGCGATCRCVGAYVNGMCD